LQHAHNPVNWYPWGEKAFQKPKKNKLVIISIGYAACHWCHVMEEALKMWLLPNMNAHFVCISGSRRASDVDQVYMTAAQLLEVVDGH
jgi:uncharacterized protein YyaL (SSP411 family)